MNDDPFLTLLIEALNLMHPRFAAHQPVREFYHQLRRLWDKALPVQLGLGHIMIQSDPEAPPGPQPDFLIWQLGEHGRPDCRLAAVSFIPEDATIATLSKFKGLGYPYAVAIALDHAKSPIEGIIQLVYDRRLRTAMIQESAT